MHRARWGLAGLLGFEAMLAAYALANAAPDYAAMAVAAAGALGWALLAHARSGTIPRGALGLLAVVALLRALNQTAFAGVYPGGVLPTFLVPLGFALLLWPRAPPALGIGLVAAARSWFVLWYFLQGVPPLIVANLVGALGAWVWWADETLVVRPAPADEGAPQS